MHRLACLLALAAAALPALPSAALDEALYARILRQHTREVNDLARVRVDYAAIARSADWKTLVASLAATDPATLRTRDEQLAFWVNAYNILAIDLVAANYPLDSIRDIGSFFSPVWKREAGLQSFEPGAGGDYKFTRGFDARPTYSLHHLRDPRLAAAIARFLEAERADAHHTIAQLNQQSALKPRV